MGSAGWLLAAWRRPHQTLANPPSGTLMSWREVGKAGPRGLAKAGGQDCVTRVPDSGQLQANRGPAGAGPPHLLAHVRLGPFLADALLQRYELVAPSLPHLGGHLQCWGTHGGRMQRRRALNKACQQSCAEAARHRMVRTRWRQGCACCQWLPASLRPLADAPRLPRPTSQPLSLQSPGATRPAHLLGQLCRGRAVLLAVLEAAHALKTEGGAKVHQLAVLRLALACGVGRGRQAGGVGGGQRVGGTCQAGGGGPARPQRSASPPATLGACRLPCGRMDEHGSRHAQHDTAGAMLCRRANRTRHSRWAPLGAAPGRPGRPGAALTREAADEGGAQRQPGDALPQLVQQLQRVRLGRPVHAQQRQV